jgi:3-oxoacyl-[acyl-carrier protein] reductase
MNAEHVSTAYIALGSNLGDRHANLQTALRLLAERGIEVVRVSSYHETEPVGGPAGQGPYLNAAAAIRTNLEPAVLLQVLLDVERHMGRVRGERNEPRMIDLDLLLFEDRLMNEAGLELPHPRLHERWFVLAPLAEIAPALMHPVLKKTMRELLSEVPATAATGGPAAPGRELSGQRALVTGATSGIGRAIAQELAAAGAEVIVHGRRPDAADQVARAIVDRGGAGHVLLADLHSIEACRRLVDEAWKTHGPIGIWINNAGTDILTGAHRRANFEEKLQKLLQVDVVATIILSRAVGRRMQAAGRGVILNMGWDQAETGMEGDSGQLFGTAKSAVMAFSKSLAVSLAPAVRVNCLAPGWIRTAWGETASNTWQERARRESLLQRWGMPADVARAARWLVSPAASFITGQVVRINGGAVR